MLRRLRFRSTGQSNEANFLDEALPEPPPHDMHRCQIQAQAAGFDPPMIRLPRALDDVS